MDFRYETVIPNDDLPFRMFIFEGRDGNYRVSKHWHQSVELFLVLEGALDFFINSRQYTLKPNDFVIVNPNEIHSIECPDPNITIVLQIPMKSFEGYMSDESRITFADKDESQKARLVSLVTAMYRTYEKGEFGYRLKVKSQFMEFLYLIVTEFRIEQIDKVRVQQKRHLDKLSQVTQYMKENYDKELSLEMVASRFGFTPSYLSHMFREYAQTGYRTYLMDLRVKYAMRELLNSDRYVGDIALDHGFADARAFAKAFKKRYGCLPSQYRKQMNQKQVNQKQMNQKQMNQKQANQKQRNRKSLAGKSLAGE
ncbi:MAG: AraC family transcriptional regulator [Enterocloster bolteae]